jgi:membrane associated rhomboid family serine protease
MSAIFPCPYCGRQVVSASEGPGSVCKCPSCGATVQVPNPELDRLARQTEKVRPGFEEHDYSTHAREARQMVRSGGFAGYILLGIIIAVYFTVASRTDDEQQYAQALQQYGALVPEQTAAEPWRLVTCLFLHAGLLHLFFNAYALFLLTRYIEPTLGAGRFLALFLLTGVASSIGSLVAMLTQHAAHPEDPWHWSIGASGAILGLLGAMIGVYRLDRPRMAMLYPKSLRTQMLFWIAFTLVLGFIQPNIDNGGHLGGLFAGLGLGYCFGHRISTGMWGRRLADGAAVLIVYGALAAYLLWALPAAK